MVCESYTTFHGALALLAQVLCPSSSRHGSSWRSPLQHEPGLTRLGARKDGSMAAAHIESLAGAFFEREIRRRN